MHPPLRLAAGTAVLAMTCGCTQSPVVGESLGTIGYVRDRHPASTPATYLYTTASIADLTGLVDGLDAPDVAQRLHAVDPSTHVVVALYFDACAKSEPALALNGGTLTVRYGAIANRTCVRAADTLALFAVPRSQLPDPTVLEVCERRVTLSGTDVSGDPIGLC